MQTTTLTIAELEQHDPHAPRGKRERRFLCPLCGSDKPRDRAHRSLAADTSTGAWVCHRCMEKGLLREFWTDRPIQTKRARSRASVARAFALSPIAEAPQKSEAAIDPQLVLESSVAIEGTPGAAYIEGRGIPVDVAHEAGVRFSSSFYGRAAVLFPMHDKSGALVAVNGRFIDGRDNPKTQTAGNKSLGLFTTPGALSSPLIAVCEGAMDALALWLCGVPSVALVGTSSPEWMPRSLAFSAVLLATDADKAGDDAAARLVGELEARAARTFRLRPRSAKDWGEALQLMGAETLRTHLAAFSEVADTETRVNAVCDLAEGGRKDAALFVASLIEDAEPREHLRSALRRDASVLIECLDDSDEWHIPAWIPQKQYEVMWNRWKEKETTSVVTTR